MISGHGDVATRLEEHAAKHRLEFVQFVGQVFGVQAGQVQPHAAIDIAANRLWHHETTGLQDRADRNALRFVKIWCYRYTLEARGEIEGFGVGLGELFNGLG